MTQAACDKVPRDPQGHIQQELTVGKDGSGSIQGKSICMNKSLGFLLESESG